MKNYIFTILASIFICSAMISCSSKGEVVYQCPMKCEGDKTYDSPGNCPECGMDLKEIPKPGDKGQSGNEENEKQEHETGDSAHTHP